MILKRNTAHALIAAWFFLTPTALFSQTLQEIFQIDSTSSSGVDYHGFSGSTDFFEISGLVSVEVGVAEVRIYPISIRTSPPGYEGFVLTPSVTAMITGSSDSNGDGQNDTWSFLWRGNECPYPWLYDVEYEGTVSSGDYSSPPDEYDGIGDFYITGGEQFCGPDGSGFGIEIAATEQQVAPGIPALSDVGIAVFMLLLAFLGARQLIR